MIGSAKVTLGITATLGAALLSGCSEEDPEWVRQCVERSTDIRVEDALCPEIDTPTHPYQWYYHHSTTRGVPVGSKVSGGSYSRPATSTFYSVPRSGGFGGTKGSTAT